MTVLGTILSFYPALCVGLAIADLLWFAAAPSWQPVLAMAFLLYGFPLFSFRLHNLFFR